MTEQLQKRLQEIYQTPSMSPGQGPAMGEAPSTFEGRLRELFSRVGKAWASTQGAAQVVTGKGVEFAQGVPGGVLKNLRPVTLALEQVGKGIGVATELGFQALGHPSPAFDKYAAQPKGIRESLGRLLQLYEARPTAEQILPFAAFQGPLALERLTLPAQAATARAATGQIARRAIASVQSAAGKPEAALRTRFGQAAAKGLAGAAKEVPLKNYEVTVTKGTIKPKGGIEGPFERVFTVQAKTRKAAIKAVQDAGIPADKVSVRLKPAAEVARGQAEMPITKPLPETARPAVQPPIGKPTEAVAPQAGRAWETGAERPFAFDPNSTANQGRFRLLPPIKGGSYTTRQSGTPGVFYIVDTEANAIQAVRFNKPQFSEAQAAEWWEANRARLGRPTAQPGPVAVTSKPAPSAALEGPPLAQAESPRPVGAAAGGVPPVKPPRRPLWADIPEEPPRQPPGELPVPEALPSGRRPGGIGKQTPPPPSDNYQRLVEALEPPKDPFEKRARDALTAFNAKSLDRNHALWKLQQATRIPVHDLSQVVPGATSAGEAIVSRTTRPLITSLGRDAKYLERYMVLMRADDILALNPHARLPGGMEGSAGRLQAMQRLQKDMGSERFAAVENVARQLWQITDEQVLAPLVRGGILSPAARQAMRADHPHYIPFPRADFTEAVFGTASRPEANVSASGIQRMALEGSERALDQPLVRLEAQVIRTQQILARNKAARSVVDALTEIQRTTGEELVRFVEPKGTMAVAERVTGQALPRAAKGEHSKIWETISYFKDGEKQTVEVPAIYGRVAKGLDGEAASIYSTVLRALSAPLRHGAVTYNPAFVIVNPLRDAFSAFFREKLIPLSPEYLRGWIAVVKRNATFEEAAQSGALLSGIVDTMRSTSALSRARTLGALSVRNPLDALLVIPRLIEKANIKAEQATRVATFAKLRAEGMDQLMAAVKARNVTVDFAKMGTTMRLLNDAYPFFNASVQGTMNTLNTIKTNPKWAALAASPFIAATAISRVNNMRFETSEKIPDYEYTNNWVFQVGEGKNADGTAFPIYIKIPKGPIGGILTFPGEALFNLARDQEDRSAAELLLDAGGEALRATSPIDPGFGSVIPTAAAQTVAGLATGVDLWRKTPIIPRREEGRLAEQQFGRETSTLAVKLGQQFKVSPRMVDFAINDYTAGAGQTSSYLVSAFLDAMGVRPEEFGAAVSEKPTATAVQQLSKAPGVGRFVGTRATQLERRGWEQFDQAVEETQRQFNEILGMNALGLKLGEVGGTFDMTPGIPKDSIDLTPQQRAEYQKAMAELVTPGIEAYVSHLPATIPAGLKREMIQKQMTTLKKTAGDVFRPRLQLQQLQSAATPVAPTGANRDTRARMDALLAEIGAR